MKKLVCGMIVVASISLTNVFAQTKTECTTSTTTQSNGWDDYIPYWQNNTTKSIKDCDDGSRTITTTENHGLSKNGNSASISKTTIEYYSPEEMNERGGNYYTSGE
jgi:Tfp pilus assembly protein PilX